MSGAGWGKKTSNQRPQGTVRRSQVVTTFGPGAMVDLIDHAVLVGGLDFWNFDATKGGTTIVEPRLREAIAERFKVRKRKLSIEDAFREPPTGDEQDSTPLRGIQVLEFPRWHVCQSPSCRALVRSDNLELKRERYHHACNRSKSSETVPIRFVAACSKGHIQDFPWIYFVHAGSESGPCPAPSLSLEEGASGDFSEVVVVCSCGERRSLAHALVEEANPVCHGDRPWLGPEGQQPCAGQNLRLLVRTASNGYFPQVVSALSVPDEAGALQNAVRQVWDVLTAADKDSLPAFRLIPKVKAALSPYSDADVLATIASIRKGEGVPREPLRTAEWKQFLAASPEKPGELPRIDERFFVRRGGVPKVLAGWVERLVLAHKLREVRAQIGFTRIEPVTADLQGEFDLGVEVQDLGLQTDWLPATEILGEGVFIQLDEARVQAWEKRPQVIQRGVALLAGYDAWAEGVDRAPPFPGIRFYMLHSLAHLLVSAVSLEAGYSASSIRERIYCAAGDSDTPMAGILLSTGSSGTDGTLGGLVEQGRHLERHFRRAFQLGKLCSNDPVCGHHSPQGDPSERFLEGAACHGCLFIAECSCERFNCYLDRALVVPTMGHAPELAFLNGLL